MLQKILRISTVLAIAFSAQVCAHDGDHSHSHDDSVIKSEVEEQHLLAECNCPAEHLEQLREEYRKKDQNPEIKQENAAPTTTQEKQS